MSVRRRFFPSTAVQQVPGRTVELEVQLQPEGAAAAPAQAPAPAPAPASDGAVFALAWPTLAGPTSMWPYDYPPGSPEDAGLVAAFSVGASGTWNIVNSFSGGAVLPFQLLALPDKTPQGLPEGWSVEWRLVSPSPEDAPEPEVVFNQATGRGYVDMRLPPEGRVELDTKFFFEIRLLEGSELRGRLTVIKVNNEGYPWTAYGRVGWYAWA